MYCDFFGLRCRPFEDRADTEFYFTTPEHEEALASIEYEARYGHGMALLLGEPGTGKTLLVRTLLRKLAASDRAVVLTWPASGQGDLIRETCKGFGISLPASHQSTRLATRLSRFLTRSHEAGHRSVLVIDQAENLTAQNLAQLETLTETQRDGESPLSIILSATPRFRDTLARDEFGRLRQKLFGERSIGPLSLEQTHTYIMHRLQIAGAGERQPFSPDAIGPIFEASKGIPRLINRICDAAMIATYGAGKSTIDGAVAAEVAMNECGIERSVDVRKLGLDKADSGAPGWSPDGRGGSLALPQPPRPVSNRTQIEEWGEPHVDLAGVSDDVAGDPMHTSYLTQEPEAGLGVASATAFAQPVSLPTGPQSGGADALLTRLTRATARAERAGATTEASIAKNNAIEKHLTALNADAERLTGSLAEKTRVAASSLDAMQQRLAGLDSAVEETAAGVEERISQASCVASELQEQIAVVNEACRKGDRVQSQLTAFADELADKGHGVQERMTRLIASVESSEAAKRIHAEFLEHASTTATKTKVELTRTVLELEQRIKTAVKEATSRSGNAEEKLERILDRCSSCICDARQQVGTLVRTASAIETEAEQGLQSSAAAFEKVKQEARQFEEEVLHTAVERWKTHVTDAHQQADALVRTASDIAKETEQGLQSSTAAFEKVKQEAREFEKEFLRTSVERCRTRISDAHQQVDALVRTASDVATETEKTLQRSNAAFEKVKQDAHRFEEEFVRSTLERCKTHISGAHQQVEALVRTASDIATETEQGVQRSNAAFEKAKKDAHRFEEELVHAVLERCKTHISDAYQRVNALVRTVSDITTETEQGLQRSTAAFENVKQDAHRFEEELVRSVLEHCKSQLEKQLAQQVETQVRSGQESIEAVLNRAAVVTAGAERAVGAIEEKFSSKMTKLEQFIEEFTTKALDACRTRLKAHLETQFEAAEARVTASCHEIDAKLAGYERSTSDMLDAATARTQELEERMRDLEGRRDAVASALTFLSPAVDDAKVKASELDETIKTASRTVDQLVVRADATQVGLSHIVSGAEHLIGEAHAVRGQLETLQHAAASTLVDVGCAHEKLASITKQTDKTEQLIGQLSRGRDACESTVRKLNERAQNAEELIQRALEVESNGAEQATTLESRMESAQALLDQLSGTCAIAKSTDEGIVGAIRRAEDVTQEADRQRSRIGTVLASGQKLRGQLDEIIVSGTQLHEAMQGVVAHVDDKVVQLGSHQAAAAHVAKSLSGMTVSGRKLLNGLIESKRGNQEASERIERMTTDAWELASVAETRMKELSDASGAAQELVENLEKASQPVESAVAGLIEGTSNAKQQVDALDQRQALTRQLTDEFNGITSVLDSARKAEESIKATHEAATETLARLTIVTETAATHVDTLGPLSEAASHAQQQSAESATKAEEAAARLVAHLSAVEKAVESGVPLLGDFVKQTRSLETVLASLDTRCMEIEERFTAATEKPAEIIATAQAQSAQLERVCLAVRKVFSGLSKVTLEARKQINDSRTTSESTSSRLAQLNSETERASNTLHEWVQEAVRVQSRLEGTLRKAPSISETHPADALRAMSRLTTKATGLSDSRRAVSPTPAPVAAATQAGPSVARAPTSVTDRGKPRADEVAQLIEDAKRTGNTAAN